MKSLRVAVIGGGIAGITAAHLIQKKHEVTLYESAKSLGGHAHAVPIEEAGRSLWMDTAFLVFNERTYPLFMALLKEWGVYDRAIPAEMSACFSDSQKDLHYALKIGLSAVFYQRRNLFNPEFYRMFFDLMRFRKRGWSDLESGSLSDEQTIGEYLHPYSALFRENLAIPMAVSIWSLPRQQIESFPAKTLLRFFGNHQLLKGKSEECWRTLRGSSKQYVDGFQKGFRGRILLDQPVRRVKRNDASVTIESGGSAPDVQNYDRVVFATHADTTLDLIDDPTGAESALLGAWRYHSNVTTLHTDASILHPEKKLWSSWNVRIGQDETQITYYLNRIQSITADRDYFLSVGDFKIDPKHVIQRFTQHHPIFDKNSLATQQELPKLNGSRNSFFCGSYFGFGFHEDAVRSAKEVAKSFDSHFDQEARS